MSADAKDTSTNQEFSEVLHNNLAEARAHLDASLASANAAVEEGIKLVATGVGTGVAVVVEVLQDGVTVAEKMAEESKTYAGIALGHLKRVEDVLVAEVKAGLAVVAANPYVSYPLLATGGLMLLPGTRRLLYRFTLGQLRSVDNVMKSSEGKVEGLRIKMSDYANEAKKLQERLTAAEEEYVRGRAKLRATRQELQRLATVVAKSERAASGVLEDLRTIKKVDKAMQLRAEAANQISALRGQRSALQAFIYRIASRDI